MILNSALSQNWVGCTWRTPRTQVARILRAQCPCRGRCCAHSKLVVSMSRAQPAQVACSTCAGRVHSAQVVGACRDLLPLPSPRPGRDIISRSRPPGRLSQVATSILCCDLLSPYLNRPGRDTKPPLCRLNHGATSNRCRDTTQAYPGRNTKTRSRPSLRLPYVATSNLCRDTVSAHSGLSRS